MNGAGLMTVPIFSGSADLAYLVHKHGNFTGEQEFPEPFGYHPSGRPLGCDRVSHGYKRLEIKATREGFQLEPLAECILNGTRFILVKIVHIAFVPPGLPDAIYFVQPCVVQDYHL